MGLKLGMGISLLLGGRSGSRDLTLGCTIWNIYGKELFSVWCVCWGGLDWGWFHSRLVSGVGYEVLLEQVHLNFSFRNKFVILPCGLLVDNNTFLKMYVFKSSWRNSQWCHAEYPAVKFLRRRLWNIPQAVPVLRTTAYETNTLPFYFFYFVLWPTNSQLFHKLSHFFYMFRHYHVILRELVLSNLPSYISMSNAVVGNTIYN
jgi:hypothetical protein